MAKFNCWRKLVVVLGLAIIGNLVLAQNTLPIYIGSYTTNANPAGKGAGIYRIGLDLDSGEIIPYLFLAAQITNPSYILIGNHKLYTVNEIDNYSDKSAGSVTAFNVESNGTLTLINQVSSIGANPVSLTTDRKWQNIIVANYGNGNLGSAGIAIVPVTNSGALQDATQIIEYTGHGLDQDRQATPHTHAVEAVWINNQELVFSVDLGLDTIFSYTLDISTGLLTQNTTTIIADESYSTKPTGPRHIALSLDKNYLFVANELSSDIYVYQLNKKTGSLTFVQKVKSYGGQLHAKRNYPAEIMVKPNSSYLYVSNRGQNTIAQFKINVKTGKLSYISEVSTYGDFPRDFDIDMQGRYLVVANQKSDNVTLFNINSKNGNLVNPVTFDVPTPVTVKFANE